MKRTLVIASLFIILVCGIAGVRYAFYNGSVSYDGSDVNVVNLYNNPNMDITHDNPDGVAALIVEENLAGTMAANNVAAVVFDFRGFDTLGESFILLTAIAGSFVILSRPHKAAKKKEGTSDEV